MQARGIFCPLPCRPSAAAVLYSCWKNFSYNSAQMETREGNLSFGTEIEEQFRLHIHVDVQGQRRLMLYRNEIAVRGVLSPALALLQFFAQNPNEFFRKSTIQDALNLKDFDKSLSNLRKGLGEDFKDSRIIETKSNGYRFLLDVQKQGDLGVEVFPRWRQKVFFDLLDKVTFDKKDDEDLRFVTFFFTCGVLDLGLDKLLKNGARIRIVLIDPDENWIWEARFGLRKDAITPGKAKALAIGQIEDLKSIAREARKAKATGTIELKLSKSMPSAFIAHSGKRAVTGMLLTPCSYVAGPMIEVLRDTEPWEKLYEDWLVRWEPGTPVELYAEAKRDRDSKQ